LADSKGVVTLDNIKTVYSLSEVQIESLIELYKDHFWCSDRKIDDIKIMLKNSNIVALVNTENNEIIAFARFLSDHVYRAMLYDVIVSKKYRGLGFGRQILDAVIKDEKIKNVERIELYSRDYNVKFYEKLGYENVTEGLNLMRYSHKIFKDE
jgi:predicted GNAT family N-acyltransferase